MADINVKIGGDTSKLDKKVKSMKSKFKAFGEAAKIAIAGVGSAFLVLAKKATNVAAKFEQTTVAYTTMLGSASKASKVLQELTQFSTVTPFEPEEVYQAGKRLLAFGVTTKDLIPTLRKLGDIAAGTGKDFNELSSVFGKIKTKGKAQAEELNQLAEAGIPIIQELADMYGLTAEQVYKLGSAGSITFADIETAFARMTAEGSRFGGMMDKQSQTFNGMVSTLKGNISELGKSIAMEWLPHLKDVTAEMNAIVSGHQQLKDLVKKTGAENVKYDWRKNITSIDVAASSDAEVEAERLRLIRKFKKEGKDVSALMRDAKSETLSALEVDKKRVEVKKDELKQAKMLDQIYKDIDQEERAKKAEDAWFESEYQGAIADIDKAERDSENTAKKSANMKERLTIDQTSKTRIASDRLASIGGTIGGTGAGMNLDKKRNGMLGKMVALMKKDSMIEESRGGETLI